MQGYFIAPQQSRMDFETNTAEKVAAGTLDQFLDSSGFLQVAAV